MWRFPHVPLPSWGAFDLDGKRRKLAVVGRDRPVGGEVEVVIVEVAGNRGYNWHTLQA